MGKITKKDDKLFLKYSCKVFTLSNDVLKIINELNFTITDYRFVGRNAFSHTCTMYKCKRLNSF